MQSDSRPFERATSESVTIWTIAAGVCIGSLSATFIAWSALEVRLRWEIDRASTELREQVKKTQSMQLQELEDAARTAQRQVRETERLATEKRQVEAEYQHANETMRREAAEADRKDAAWKRFYKPSPGCETAATSVECANEYIRASRAFLSKYSEGGI